MSLLISSNRWLLHLQDNRKWKCRKPKEVKHLKEAEVASRNTVRVQVEIPVIQVAVTVAEIEVQTAVHPNRPVVKNHGVTVMQVIAVAAVLQQEAAMNAEADLRIKAEALHIRKDLKPIFN